MSLDREMSPFRPGVPMIVGIVWNVPLGVLFVLAMKGVVGPNTLLHLCAAWSAVLPIASLLLAFSPTWQRWLLLPTADVEVLRPRLLRSPCCGPPSLPSMPPSRFSRSDTTSEDNP